MNARERAQAELPGLAGRLGLSYRPSTLPGHAGELNGIVAGHRVLVRPDRPALFVEYRFRVDGLRLSTVRPRGAGRPGEALCTGHPAFERHFPRRTASGPAGEALRAASEFHAAAAAWARRWQKRHVRLDFEAAQLCATLPRRGWPRRRAYVTAREAEALLPELLGLVQTLEDALRVHALQTALRR